MNENGNGLGTDMAGRPTPTIPKVEYFKFSPSTLRYQRVFALAEKRGCTWQEVIRNSIDFYLEFQEKQTTILTLS